MALYEGGMEENQSNQEDLDQWSGEKERAVIVIACGKSWYHSAILFISQCKMPSPKGARQANFFVRFARRILRPNHF